jgi:sugar/nucleoside kinase (ribokinase family)
MSATFRYDVAAIGNALVDVVSRTDDDFLQKHAIDKGTMTLVDAERSAAIYKNLGPAIETSGGSAANTAAGIASFGGRPAFMGKVHADQFGTVFKHDLESQGVHFATPLMNEGDPTGRCLVLVTPDAQRSMCTYLGSAVSFGPEDVEEDIIAASDIVYLEGYLFDRPQAKAGFRHAAKLAHQHGKRLALSLSDPFCVNRHREDFRNLVRDEVDILFANQHEIEALYETQDLNAAVATARGECGIVVATRGEKGAIIAQGKELVEVPAVPPVKLVDTTGAGDLFAAGFLFGLTQGRDLAQSGMLGARAASEVISDYGPRPRRALREVA